MSWCLSCGVESFETSKFRQRWGRSPIFACLICQPSLWYKQSNKKQCQHQQIIKVWQNCTWQVANQGGATTHVHTHVANPVGQTAIIKVGRSIESKTRIDRTVGMTLHSCKEKPFYCTFEFFYIMFTMIFKVYFTTKFSVCKCKKNSFCNLVFSLWHYLDTSWTLLHKHTFQDTSQTLLWHSICTSISKTCALCMVHYEVTICWEDFGRVWIRNYFLWWSRTTHEISGLRNKTSFLMATNNAGFQ